MIRLSPINCRIYILLDQHEGNRFRLKDLKANSNLIEINWLAELFCFTLQSQETSYRAVQLYHKMDSGIFRGGEILLETRLNSNVLIDNSINSRKDSLFLSTTFLFLTFSFPLPVYRFPFTDPLSPSSCLPLSFS